MRQISWKTCYGNIEWTVTLRNVVVGMGGKVCGFPREDHFMITVASEIMAALCLATSLQDLKARFGRIVIGSTYDDQPVYVHQLGCEGAMLCS